MDCAEPCLLCASVSVERLQTLGEVSALQSLQHALTGATKGLLPRRSDGARLRAKKHDRYAL